MPTLDSPFDAVLHLLDRQVVDVDGRMVCKVDDLELTQWTEGTVAATALLVGAPALLPRFGGRLGSWLLTSWLRLAPERADRAQPGRIGLERVAELGSAVHLNTWRVDVVRPQEPPDPGLTQHRLDDLLDARVHSRDGHDLGAILDVRVRPEPFEGTVRLVLTDLVVGRGRPGSLLGYDRNASQGPLLVRLLVRWIHRDRALVAFADASVDWAEGLVTTSAPTRPLEPAG